MTSPHNSHRWPLRATIVATICLLGFLGLAGSVSAAPYPPVPPIGQVPAIATVPAPQIAAPVMPGFRTNAGSTVIAPGSYPVQARTGAGPTPRGESHGAAVLVAMTAFAGLGVAGVGAVAARRSRRVRLSP